jgi:hypothetical protein
MVFTGNLNYCYVWINENQIGAFAGIDGRTQMRQLFTLSQKKKAPFVEPVKPDQQALCVCAISLRKAFGLAAIRRVKRAANGIPATPWSQSPDSVK